MIPGACACGVCGDREHSSRDCPTLYSPLTPGFYSGGGGGGGHSHDDEDESAEKKTLTSPFSFTAYSTRYSAHTPSYTWSRTFHMNDRAYCS